MTPANPVPPITEPDEFGIVWDSHSHWTTMGMTIFDSVESRRQAVTTLEELGFRYLTLYQDVHGPGLSWAERTGRRLRPSAAARLPSVQRESRRQAAFDRFQRGLYKNPSYDLVNI